MLQKTFRQLNFRPLPWKAKKGEIFSPAKISRSTVFRSFKYWDNLRYCVLFVYYFFMLFKSSSPDPTALSYCHSWRIFACSILVAMHMYSAEEKLSEGNPEQPCHMWIQADIASDTNRGALDIILIFNMPMWFVMSRQWEVAVQTDTVWWSLLSIVETIL